MDWATRKLLSRRLSDTRRADFCFEALDEAFAKYRVPEIMSMERFERHWFKRISLRQGSQPTGHDLTGQFQVEDIRIPIAGRGRFLDNMFIKRLWRSLKQEAIYLEEITDGFQAKRIIENGWFFTIKTSPFGACLSNPR